MKGMLLFLITVLLFALVSCGSGTSAPETEGGEPATSAVEGITTESTVTEGIPEDEIPEQSTAPSGEVDLPKVEF